MPGAVPPCRATVPNLCGHVNCEGQSPVQLPTFCQRPLGHPTAAEDGVGCVGCFYCVLEMTIAAYAASGVDMPTKPTCERCGSDRVTLTRTDAGTERACAACGHRSIARPAGQPAVTRPAAPTTTR